MPILPPPTYEQVQNDRLQEVENFYKQNQDRNSRNDFTIIEFGGPQQESSAPMNRMLDLELNEQRLRGKSFIILLFLILLSLQPNDPKKSMGKQVVPLLLLLSFFLFSSSLFALEYIHLNKPLHFRQKIERRSRWWRCYCSGDYSFANF